MRRRVRGITMTAAIRENGGSGVLSMTQAGNMTSGPKAGDEATRLHYVYDAWNRMTAAHADNNGQQGTLIASYEYDGQGRRIEKLVSGGDDLDYYLSEQNQVLEVRADDAPYASEQYVWDIRYVDGLILRDAAGDEQGDLDETFGDDGVILGGPGDIGPAEQVIVQRDGKVLVLDGGAGLVRYNADGGLDTGFGDVDGQQRTGWTRLAVSGWYLGSAGAEELPDGKLLVGGMAWTDGTDDVLLVARYNADGTLDSNFGSGGVEMIDVSQTQYESIYAMAVQSDGKVILAGSLYDELADSYDAVLVRVMEDPQNPGQLILDDDFGTDGVAVLDAGAYDEVYDLKLDGQGRIIAGGPVGSQWWAARFTADGGLDPTFGTVSGQTRTGWRTVDFTGSGTETFAGLELYPDGRVLLGGYKASNVILARLTAAGDDDTSFSDDGQATLGGSYAEAALDLALQPDGRIVVAGMWFGSSPYNYQVLAGRVNADGTMDSSFGDGGWTRIELMGVNFNAEYAVSLAVQPGGKVVLAGRADSATASGPFIARLSGMTRHYAMQDANWTITGIINPETGQAVERYVFVPYGGRTVLGAAFEQRSTSSFGWIVGHQGLAVDAETGLVYNRARYLDTSMGRFTVRDPIGGGSPVASTVLSEQWDYWLQNYKDVVLDEWVWQEAKDEVARDYKLTGDLQARWNEKVTWRSTVGDLVTNVYRKKVEWYATRKRTCTAGTMEEYTLVKAAFREKNVPKVRADTRSPAMRENCLKLGQLIAESNDGRPDAMRQRILINNEGSLWGALWDTGCMVGPDLLAAVGSRPSSRGSVTMAAKASGGLRSLMSAEQAAKYDAYWQRCAPPQITPGTTRVDFSRVSGRTGRVENSRVIYDEFGRQRYRVDLTDHLRPPNLPHDPGHTNPHLHERIYDFRNTPNGYIEVQHNLK